MKCINCGFEGVQNFEKCPFCSQPTFKITKDNPAENAVLAALKDNLFLVICILMTIGVGLPILKGSFAIINILFTAFLWITYASATKNKVDVSSIKGASGTAFANYIIMYVLSGLFVVLGGLLALIFSLVSNNAEFYSTFMQGFAAGFGEGWEQYLPIANAILKIPGIVLFAILALAAGGMLVVNIFYFRNLHKLVKSVYSGVLTHNPNFEKVETVRIWMLVLGIMSAVSAVSSVLTSGIIIGVSSIALAAAQIIAAILIGKYLDGTKIAVSAPAPAAETIEAQNIPAAEPTLNEQAPAAPENPADNQQ